MGALIPKMLVTLAGFLGFLFAAAGFDARRVDQLPPRPVPLTEVADGPHRGHFMYQNQVMEVAVTTRDHRIVEISVARNLSGDLYASAAQTVASRVRETQTTDIASDPSDSLQQRAHKKAILRAIENALRDLPAGDTTTPPPRPWPVTLLLGAFFLGCGSLGAHWAGFIGFRRGMLGVARFWVSLEQLAFWAGTISLLLALLLIWGTP